MTVKNFSEIFELDELYWFIERKPRTKTRENVCFLTMVSRESRQIVGFDVALDKSPIRIQNMVDNAPPASKYCTDGYLGYIDVAYPSKHGVMHAIKAIRLRLKGSMPICGTISLCLRGVAARKLETLWAVMDVY